MQKISQTLGEGEKLVSGGRMEICEIRSRVGVEWRRDNASSCSRQFLQVGEEGENSMYRQQNR